MKKKTLKSWAPNIITLFRLFLVPWILYAGLNQQWGKVFFLFLTAGVSDILDGFLARQFSATSNIGQILDPIADKMLLICSFYLLYHIDYVSTLLFSSILIRDLVLMIGAVLLLLKRKKPLQASFAGKASSFFQVTFCLSAFLELTIQNSFLKDMETFFLYALIISGIASLIYYLIKGVKAYQRH
jgi:cardiolipin synthase (CMP-forming)